MTDVFLELAVKVKILLTLIYKFAMICLGKKWIVGKRRLNVLF